ncbi:hypothetical protein NMG60_11017039 [Bertholletia excelsa]
MHTIPRWRQVLTLKNSVIPSTTMASTLPSASTHLASFHSTPISSEKWNNRRNPVSFDGKQSQKSSKNYIRYETRLKRADAKRALNHLFVNGGFSKTTFQNIKETTSWSAESVDHTGGSNKKNRSKSSTHRASKSHHKKMRRKFKRESFSYDSDEHPDTIFQATFGNRWYTWSFKSWKESYFQNSTNEFEWRDNANWTNSRDRKWCNESDIESDDESCDVGSSSDRIILGLPTKGPLKIEDVKNAFRLSALKWHPDKHQGPSQAVAGEKFKHCVNAYKSLCAALSSA